MSFVNSRLVAHPWAVHQPIQLDHRNLSPYYWWYSPCAWIWRQANKLTFACSWISCVVLPFYNKSFSIVSFLTVYSLTQCWSCCLGPLGQVAKFLPYACVSTNQCPWWLMFNLLFLASAISSGFGLWHLKGDWFPLFFQVVDGCTKHQLVVVFLTPAVDQKQWDHSLDGGWRKMEDC